jgi:hypothetical protein
MSHAKRYIDTLGTVNGDYGLYNLAVVDADGKIKNQNNATVKKSLNPNTAGE